MAPVAGFNCKLYRNTGSWGSPTWNEITIARDVTLNTEKSMAEAISRASDWRMKLPTIKDATVDFDILADTTVDDYDVLSDAYLTDDLINFAVADGTIATSGTQYFKADCYVTKFDFNEPLEDVRTVACSLELGYSANEPTIVETA